MSAPRETLAVTCPQIEGQLKPHLRGFFGGMVRGYLPQAWGFTTEAGSATLHVGQDGSASVVDGTVQRLDVAIQWTQAQLDWAIRGGGRGPRPPGGDPQITFHSSKGRTAFNFLRNRFNL